MKTGWSFASVICLLAVVACNNGATHSAHLQTQIDSLRMQLENSYKPGLGEFMSGIQMHHARLWFAGQAGNWKLADFEIKEIVETIGDIRAFNSGRPEVASIDIIEPGIDSVQGAIARRDTAVFRRSFTLLTNGCNTCHHATKHEFNVIKVPANQEFSNQEFRPE